MAPPPTPSPPTPEARLDYSNLHTAPVDVTASPDLPSLSEETLPSTNMEKPLTDLFNAPDDSMKQDFPPTETSEEMVPNFGASPDMDSVYIQQSQHSLDQLLQMTLSQGGSDLHLTSNEAAYVRIDGSMVRLTDRPIEESQILSWIQSMAPLNNFQQFKKHHDTDFAYELSSGARFRVNVFQDSRGPGATLRQIPVNIPKMADLGLPQIVKSLCNMKKGLILVTGPTGSGKSTTLAAMLEHINTTFEKHIITIEDPIEFVYQTKKCLVHQREIGRHTNSFATGLRAALREDPDIVLVGELRDLETVKIALETAETGHLVMGTLHTTTAISTIDRVIDQFPAEQQNQVRMMLASSLKAVISQSLLKRIGGGRVAAHEILINSKAVQSLIREGKNHMIGNQMVTQKQEGNVILHDQLLQLVKSKKVTALEALHAASDKPQLLSALQQAGIQVPVSDLHGVDD